MKQKQQMMMMEPAPAKPITQLVDAFCDTFKPVYREEEADEVFGIGKIREYFNAWPPMKGPDPLGPYLELLESRGYAMQTGYDGLPAMFLVRWRVSGEMCGEVKEINEKEETIRTGCQQIAAVLGARKFLYNGKNAKQASDGCTMRNSQSEESEETDEWEDEEDEDSESSEDSEDSEDEAVFGYPTGKHVDKEKLPY